MINRLRKEQRKESVQWEERMTDAKVSIAIRDLNSEASLGLSDTKSKAKNGYRTTYNVLKLLQDNKDKGVHIGERSIGSAMLACLQNGLPRAVPRLFDYMVRTGKKPSLFTLNILAASYANQRNYSRMWEIIEKMKSDKIGPNTLTYNGCIGQIYRTNPDTKICFALFKDMADSNIQPDAKSWSRLITSSSTVSQAQGCLDAMRRQMPPSYVHFNAVLSVCTRNKDALSAEQFYMAMLHSNSKDTQPNTTTYTSLMSLYKRKGDFEQVVNVYNRMKKNAVTPNTATYIVFLSSCDMMATRVTDNQRYIDVAVISFKQAITEGIDDPPLILTIGRFLRNHKRPHLLSDIRAFLEEHDIDVPRSFAYYEGAPEATLNTDP
eukprot:TRINITY_DN34779_c0_g1_i1.p1 TRINITY_DN34779_c0_g1~~TRINITY_DN34779_c0_g1_i1.p1  ORF type:complete len:396 (+),score=68.16 TRINITY_DN34779_c0_g1_i1:57-1190(+)